MITWNYENITGIFFGIPSIMDVLASAVKPVGQPYVMLALSGIPTATLFSYGVFDHEKEFATLSTR
jgi:hypothetical protein